MGGGGQVVTQGLNRLYPISVLQDVSTSLLIREQPYMMLVDIQKSNIRAGQPPISAGKDAGRRFK